MKTKHKIILLVVFSSIFVPASGQDVKGQLNFTIEAGYSPGFNGDLGVYYPVPSNYSLGDGLLINTPQLGAAIDYGIGKYLTIGLAWSFQNGKFITTDQISRTNIATRILYHWDKNVSKLDPYMGVRIGCSYWTDIFTPDSSLFSQSSYTNSPFIHGGRRLLVFNYQVFLGLNVYIVYNLGINLEVGFGDPYFSAAGLTYRINTRKPKDK